jgi:methylmalonyl-CoA mutase N-terminal domain/subunit
MLKAIERGFVQQEIQNAAYDSQRAIDTSEAMIVGVNRFRSEKEKPISLQRIDEGLERRQVERVRALRARRNQQNWKQALMGIEEAAQSGENLMPHIVNAVENFATVGEISDTLRKVFGEYQETVVI